MIQVYKKNDLYIIEDTVTDTIYPNLTKEEAIKKLNEFDRYDPEDRCKYPITDITDETFENSYLDDVEEKERYENRDGVFDTILNDYVTTDSIIDLLNRKDKRIKELEEMNNLLKTSKSHFKKVTENVVDLLKKLNKFIGEPQTRELNYCKVIEDTKNYIEQLKQSQKQLAVSELKKVENKIESKVKNIDKRLDDLKIKIVCESISKQLDTYEEIVEIIDNKIKELRGE